MAQRLCTKFPRAPETVTASVAAVSRLGLGQEDRVGAVGVPSAPPDYLPTGEVKMMQCLCGQECVLENRASSRRRPDNISSKTDIIFTDGACEPSGCGFDTGVGGIIFIPRVRVFGCKVPSELVAQWSEGRKHIIGQVELYARTDPLVTPHQRGASSLSITCVF